jgi:hypothetical protein
MLEFEEKRYPFDDAIEFFGGGFFLHPEALHLSLGWGFIIFFLAYLFIGKAHSTLKLSIPFFSLSMFTNPAYEFFSLSVNEFFGVASVFLSIALWRHMFPFMSGVGKILLAVFFVSVFHSALLILFYPELIEGVEVLKVAVTFKIFILALNILIVGQHIFTSSHFNLVVRKMVVSGNAALLLYLLQVFVLLILRTVPYGTFLDAGFVGIPSFGSVSVERGHFGKFMAPFFPFFLYAFLVWGWSKSFALFVFVTMINISASSLSFFSFSALVAIILFRRYFLRPKALFVSSASFSGLLALIFYFWEVFWAVSSKVERLAFRGDETDGGGRSLRVLFEYIEKYPWGIGYGGSSLRIGPGLPEINAGYLAFVSQYSFFAVPALVIFSVLFVATVRRCLSHGSVEARVMAVGVFLSPLYFAADILWFIPTIWLVFEMAWAATGRGPLRGRKSVFGSKETSEKLYDEAT